MKELTKPECYNNFKDGIECQDCIYILSCPNEKENLKKEIKLRIINQNKYCNHCKKVVEIRMSGKSGYCPECNLEIYTLEQLRRIK